MFPFSFAPSPAGNINEQSTALMPGNSQETLPKSSFNSSLHHSKDTPSAFPPKPSDTLISSNDHNSVLAKVPIPSLRLIHYDYDSPVDGKGHLQISSYDQEEQRTVIPSQPRCYKVVSSSRLSQPASWPSEPIRRPPSPQSHQINSHRQKSSFKYPSIPGRQQNIPSLSDVFPELQLRPVETPPVQPRMDTWAKPQQNQPIRAPLQSSHDLHDLVGIFDFHPAREVLPLAMSTSGYSQPSSGPLNNRTRTSTLSAPSHSRPTLNNQLQNGSLPDGKQETETLTEWSPTAAQIAFIKREVAVMRSRISQEDFRHGTRGRVRKFQDMFVKGKSEGEVPMDLAYPAFAGYASYYARLLDGRHRECDANYRHNDAKGLFFRMSRKQKEILLWYAMRPGRFPKMLRRVCVSELNLARGLNGVFVGEESGRLPKTFGSLCVILNSNAIKRNEWAQEAGINVEELHRQPVGPVGPTATGHIHIAPAPLPSIETFAPQFREWKAQVRAGPTGR